MDINVGDSVSNDPLVGDGVTGDVAGASESGVFSGVGEGVVG